MIALMSAVFVASVIGSLHCAGMCGGIVALCVGIDAPGQPAEQRVARSRWRTHAAYNLGRMVTYVLLGITAGALGQALDLGGSAFGLQRIAAFIAGGTMVLFGFVALLRARGVQFRCLPIPKFMQRVVDWGFRKATAMPPVRRSAMIGLMTAFLPCGWLYAFVLTAAGTGHAWSGGGTMLAFWAGTVPILLIMGIGLQGLTGAMRRYVPTATAVVLVLIGALTIMGRLSTPSYAQELDAQFTAACADNEEAEPTAFIEDLDQSTLPCCRDSKDSAQPEFSE